MKYPFLNLASIILGLVVVFGTYTLSVPTAGSLRVVQEAHAGIGLPPGQCGAGELTGFCNWVCNGGTCGGPSTNCADYGMVGTYPDCVPPVAELSAVSNSGTATVGTPATLSATISNTGSSAASSAFVNAIQVATDASGTGASTVASPSLASLAASASAPVSTSYTFSSAGTFYLRTCADSGSAISEYDETNNCSPWVAIVVAAVPAPQCSDDIDNDGDGTADYAGVVSCSGTFVINEGGGWNNGVDGLGGFNEGGDCTVVYQADPGCTSTSDTTESPNPECSDNADNDNDGYFDTSDPSCSGPTDNTEAPVDPPPAPSCSGPTGTLSATPDRIQQDVATSVTFSYTVGGSTSCTLSGPGVSVPLTPSSCSIPSGSSSATLTISHQGVYTLVCDGTTVATKIINVIPKFIEF